MAALLPLPVLCQVFTFACSDGAVPTAAYLPCVSRHWREAARLCEPALWASADLSYGWARVTNAVIARLASRGCFRATRRLCLAGCDRLSDASLEVLAQGQLASLTSLDVSSCRGITASALADLIARLPSLTALSFERSALKCEHLREVFRGCERLQAVSLAHCPRFTSSTLRSLLQLAALRSLNLTGAGVHAVTLPIELMQAAMPLLAELRVAALGSTSGWSAPVSGRPGSGGFTQLRVLHVGPATRLTQQGAVMSSSCVCDAVLARLTRDAAALRELSVPGTRVTARGLDALLTDSLRLLHVSGSACCTDAGAEVAARRWHHSLEAAEFAGPAVSDAGVARLAVCARLTSLDIASSLVTAAGLRALVLAATSPPLLDLTLSSCRHLDRSVRQAGLAGIPALRLALHCGAHAGST
jgi:hypothetical protein